MIRVISKTVKIDSGFHKRLNEFLNQLTELYNEARRERIEAYNKCGKPVGLYNQYGSLKEIRDELPEFKKFNCVAQRSVLRRLDRGFSDFLR